MGKFRDFDADSISSLIFSPDPMSRYQYGRLYEAKAGQYNSEALGKLMLAVLEDGIACFQTHFFKPSHKNERLFREAEEWIASDSDDPFSFNNICESLGINPGWLRQKLFRWKERQMRKAAGYRRRVAVQKSQSACKSCGAPKKLHH